MEGNVIDSCIRKWPAKVITNGIDLSLHQEVPNVLHTQVVCLSLMNTWVFPYQEQTFKMFVLVLTIDCSCSSCLGMALPGTASRRVAAPSQRLLRNRRGSDQVRWPLKYLTYLLHYFITNGLAFFLFSCTPWLVPIT